MSHCSRPYEDLTSFPHFDFLLNFLYNIYKDEKLYKKGDDYLCKFTNFI